MRKAAIAILCSLGVASIAHAETLTLLAWAPGYPGTAEQAQPSMDDFAHGVSAAAGWAPDELRAVYSPKVDEGLAAVEQAAVVLVPLPVYLEYEEPLRLRPLLRVIQHGGPEETWSLVARKGAVSKASDLSGWRVEGLAGFSPQFVRTALKSWGDLPDDVKIEFNGRVLSVLRRTAKGEPVAALLDRAQSEALDRLPFAAELEVVAVSAPMISSLVCAAGDRLPAHREQPLIDALLALHGSSTGDEVLATIRVVRFEALDDEALAGVHRWWGNAAN